MPYDVICDIAIYADDTTLYSKCDQASDPWQQIELTSELESHLGETMNWGNKEVAYWFRCWENSASFIWLV